MKYYTSKDYTEPVASFNITKTGESDILMTLAEGSIPVTTDIPVTEGGEMC